MTVSYVPVFLLSDFSFLLILRPPFTPHWQSPVWWSTPYPASPRYFQSIQPTALFMQQHWELRCSLSDPAGREWGEGCGALCMKPRQCAVMPRPPHSLPTPSLIHPEHLPVLQVPFTTCPLYKWTTLKISYIVFLLYFFSLDAQIALCYSCLQCLVQ